jgi:hypothetical protein
MLGTVLPRQPMAHERSPRLAHARSRPKPSLRLDRDLACVFIPVPAIREAAALVDSADAIGVYVEDPKLILDEREGPADH